MRPSLPIKKEVLNENLIESTDGLVAQILI